MNKFLETCTEKQLFVFIEASLTTLVEEQELAPLWASEQEALIISAMDETTRFGVSRTEKDFEDWYKKNRWGWFQELTTEEFKTVLREMPWNARLN